MRNPIATNELNDVGICIGYRYWIQILGESNEEYQ